MSIDLEPTEQSIKVMEAREHRAEAVSIQRLLSPRVGRGGRASPSAKAPSATRCCATSSTAGSRAA